MRTVRLAAAIVCSALLGVINAYGAEAARITAEKLRTLQLNKQVSIVDVRPPSDFAAGHIQGARNIAAPDASKAGLDKAIAVADTFATPIEDGALAVGEKYLAPHGWNADRHLRSV